MNPLLKIEIQLKITTHAQPASPTKYITSNTCMRKTANSNPNDAPWSHVANNWCLSFLSALLDLGDPNHRAGMKLGLLETYASLAFQGEPIHHRHLIEPRANYTHVEQKLTTYTKV